MASSAPLRFNRKVQSAPQQIAALIKESILEGALGPGSKLPTEEEMTELFGVSRPTLRDALRDLRARHVLEAERGRNGGYRVGDLSLVTLGDSVGEFISLSLGANKLTFGQLYEVRAALEVLSASTAALERTDADLVVLERALADVLDAPDQLPEVFRRDAAFHHSLAECTHNPLMIGFSGAAAIAFRQLTVDEDTLKPKDVLAHLDEVTEAVRAGDPRAATAAMRRHTNRFADYFGVTPSLE